VTKARQLAIYALLFLLGAAASYYVITFGGFMALAYEMSIFEQVLRLGFILIAASISIPAMRHILVITNSCRIFFNFHKARWYMAALIYSGIFIIELFVAHKRTGHIGSVGWLVCSFFIIIVVLTFIRLFLRWLLNINSLEARLANTEMYLLKAGKESKGSE